MILCGILTTLINAETVVGEQKWGSHPVSHDLRLLKHLVKANAENGSQSRAVLCLFVRE